MLHVNAQEAVRVNVAAVLRRKHISAAALARALGHSTSWASNFLNGHKSAPLSTIENIAQFLDVPVADLFIPPVVVPADIKLVPPPGLTEPDRSAGPSRRVEDLLPMHYQEVAALFYLLDPQEQGTVLSDLKARVLKKLEASLPPKPPTVR